MTAKKTPQKKPIKPQVKVEPDLKPKPVVMADIIKTVDQGGCYQIKDGVAVKQEK